MALKLKPTWEEVFLERLKILVLVLGLAGLQLAAVFGALKLPHPALAAIAGIVLPWVFLQGMVRIIRGEGFSLSLTFTIKDGRELANVIATCLFLIQAIVYVTMALDPL